MFRVDTATADAVLPAQQPVGVEGFFSKGTPPGIPATIPGPDWFNIVQEELVAIVDAAGIAHNKAVTNQVLTAIQSLISKFAPQPNFIVDPCCRVAQGASKALSTSRQYGVVDLVQCWGQGTLISAGNIVQDTTRVNSGAATATSCQLQGVTITGAGKVFFRRFIESHDANSLKNRTVIFSVLGFQDSGIGISGILTINKANAQDNFGAVTNIGAGAAINIPTGISTPITAQIAMGDCSLGIEIILEMDCGAVTNKNFYATDWQACLTALPQICPVPTFNEDYFRVLRYFESSYAYGATPGAVGGSGAIYETPGGAISNTSVILAKLFRSPKVVTPTMTYYSPATGATGKIRDFSGAADLAISDVSTTSGLVVSNNSGGVTTDGHSFGFHYTADARL